MGYTLKNSATRLNKVAAIISQVIHIDVEIADSNLLRVAGTGKLGKKINQSMANEGHAYSIALKTGQPQIITEPGLNPICQNCPQRHGCKETFEISYPIQIEGEVIGIIGLVAYTKQQQQRLTKELTSYSDFLEKVSQFIAFDIQDMQRNQSQDLSISILETLLNEVTLGILTIDAKTQVRLVNSKAKALLKIPITTASHASVEPLFQSSKGTGEYRLYIDGHHFQVLGKMYRTFLQEHSTILLFSENRVIASNSHKKASKDSDIIWGHSRVISQMQEHIAGLAYFKVNILILAEQGLDVRETALAIHENSILSGKRFYELNCRAYTETDLSHQLFSTNGLLEKAAGQCLFLRNVDSLTMRLQLLLLDTLETGQIFLDGHTKKLYGGTRIIASSDHDLEKLASEGLFSQELYYLLSSDTVRIPALRERGEDIVQISKIFLRQQKSLFAAAHIQYSSDFEKALLNYSWPGNLLELRNVMYQIAIQYPNSTILTADMLPKPINLSVPSTPASAITVISEDEQLIRDGLKKFGDTLSGKQQLAAELGISIATLYRRLKKYQL